MVYLEQFHDGAENECHGLTEYGGAGRNRQENDMDPEQAKQEILEKLEHAEKILIGIGNEWNGKSGRQPDEVKQAAASLKKITEGKDFFLITGLTGEAVSRLGMKPGHVAAPFDETSAEEQWDAYMKWLSFTLNRKTLILELGEDFSRPSLMRWPFEKTAMLNRKAFLYRIGQNFYQIPDELKDKARGVQENSVDFAAALGNGKCREAASEEKTEEKQQMEEAHGSNQQ